MEYNTSASIRSDNLEESRISTVLTIFKELTTNQHAPNLTSPCSNLIQLCISEKTASWVLVNVSIPSQTLNGLNGHYDKQHCLKIFSHVNMNLTQLYKHH
jgi:hypothetical protein